MFLLLFPIPPKYQLSVPILACYHHLLFLQKPIHSFLLPYLHLIPQLFSLFLQHSPNSILQRLLYSHLQPISPVYLQQQSNLLFLHDATLFILLLLYPAYSLSLLIILLHFLLSLLLPSYLFLLPVFVVALLLIRS